MQASQFNFVPDQAFIPKVQMNWNQENNTIQQQ
jgi:hypothetical protein